MHSGATTVGNCQAWGRSKPGTYPQMEVAMKSTVKALAIATGLGVIDGCAMDSATKPWWTLKQESFVPVKPGVTKAEVRSMLGKPMLESAFPRLDEEVWDYRYVQGTTFVYLTEIHFDRQGLVKYYTQYPDPAYNRRR